MDEKVRDMKGKIGKDIEIFERKQLTYTTRNQTNQNHQIEMLGKKKLMK